MVTLQTSKWLGPDNQNPVPDSGNTDHSVNVVAHRPRLAVVKAKNVKFSHPGVGCHPNSIAFGTKTIEYQRNIYRLVQSFTSEPNEEPGRNVGIKRCNV
jgi:hypothetical protein